MAKRNPIAWLLPSIGDVIFLCTFLWILHKGLGLLNDGDTGWHIVTGRMIIDTLTIPFADPYSHTMPGTPWTAHEWLAEVIFAGLDRLGGLNAVVVFTASIICLTVLLLYLFMVRRGVSPIIAAVLTALGALASALHWLARPHAFSFLFTFAFIAALEIYQREGRDRLLLLPVLMAVWVNLHAGYILGIMLLMIYVAGNVAGWLWGSDRDRSLTMAKRLGLITALTVVATFLNPHGPKILYFPFHLVGREYIMDNILEWLSPNFHTDKAFEMVLLYMFVVFALSRKRPDIFEGLAALMMVHMSLYSARYIPLLVIIVLPMAAVRTGGVLSDVTSYFGRHNIVVRVRDRLTAISTNIAAQEAVFNRHIWPVVAVAVAMYIAANGGALNGRMLMDYRHDPKIFPVDAVEFALAEDIPGRMFNNDGWGGYIIYGTYPRFKVFFDGRSDMYGVDFLKEYAEAARAKPDYEKVLDKYGVGWVMFNANSPLCQLLACSDGWRLVYADKTANVLVRNTPEYARIIDAHPDVTFVRKDDDDG